MITRYPEIHVKKVFIDKSPEKKSDQFSLIVPFEYTHPLVGIRKVPQAFITDGLSVPQIFWGFIPPHGIGFPAAVVHDDCYINNVGANQWGHALARQVADGLFRDNCRALGMPEWQVQLIYITVRLGGQANWNKFKNQQFHA